MLKLLLLPAVLCLSLVHYGQTPKTIALADSLLKAGKFKAAIVSYEFPADIQALQNKALKNLKANPQWADKYIVSLVGRGSWRDLTFMDAYGLTRQEFDAMIAGFKIGKKAILKEESDITIARYNGLITFKAASRLAVFNHLTIDVRKQQIVFDNRLFHKEVECRGKFYAPDLTGYEAFRSQEVQGKQQQTKYGSVGFTIGRNSGDTKPTLCLLLQSSLREPEFLIVTIL